MNAIDQRVAPTKRKRITLLSNDEKFRDSVARRLEALAIYDVRIGSPEEILQPNSKQAQPTMVILDVANGDILDDPRFIALRDNWGQVPIIAVSGELSAVRMRNLVRINAVDWLNKPVKTGELLNSVTFHDSGDHASKSRITTIVGASGGAGATSVSLAAAYFLASKSAEQAAETCLVDLDFQNANCSGYLNLTNEFDIDSVVKEPDRLDVELMDVVKLVRKPGFTIYSFDRPTLPFEAMGSEFVLRLLDLVAYRYDEVIVDLPHQVTPWTDSVLTSSDQIFIVFELNIASLRHAKKLFKHIKQLRGNESNITLIANKHRRRLFGNLFSRRELKKIFNSGGIRYATLDRELLIEALNRAILPSEVSPRARFNRNLNAIFKDRLGVQKK